MGEGSENILLLHSTVFIQVNTKLSAFPDQYMTLIWNLIMKH